MIKNHICRLETLVSRLAAVVRNQAAPPPRRLQSAQDVIELLQEQAEALRASTQADAIQKARTLGFLANLAIKAIELGSLSDRMDVLEQRYEQSGYKIAR
jgi:hypothetical protein